MEEASVKMGQTKNVHGDVSFVGLSLVAFPWLIFGGTCPWRMCPSERLFGRQVRFDCLCGLFTVLCTCLYGVSILWAFSNRIVGIFPFWKEERGVRGACPQAGQVPALRMCPWHTRIVVKVIVNVEKAFEVDRYTVSRRAVIDIGNIPENGSIMEISPEISVN